MNQNLAIRIANQIKSCEGAGNFFGFAEKRELLVNRVLDNSVKKMNQ